MNEARHLIETITRFEDGVERVGQGEAVTPLFDAQRGEAVFELRPVATVSGCG